MSLNTFILTLSSFHLLHPSMHLLRIVSHLYIPWFSFLFTTITYYLFFSCSSTFFYFFLPVLAAAPDMVFLPTIVIFYKYFVSNFPSFMIASHYKLPTSFYVTSMKSHISLLSVYIPLFFNHPLLFPFYMFIISSFSLKHLSSLQLQTFPYIFLKTLLPYFYLLYTIITINTYVLLLAIYYT